MRFTLPLAALVLCAQAAQSQAPSTLTLDEAIQLARRNNPTFLQTVNARRSADAQVRTAYGSLLPSIDAQVQGRYQQSGQQFVQGVGLRNESDIVQGNYYIGASYTLNSDVLFQPRLARANREAAEADVSGNAELLRSTVTQQYIGVLQAQARAALQDTLIATAKAQLELARARQSVGSGTILDVRQAEVALGQAEVNALQQQNLARVTLLRLFQQLGVPRPDDSVSLTTRFNVTPVAFNLDSLKLLAKEHNPGLEALRSRERAASTNVRARQGSYLPTLSLSTGIGGNAAQFTDGEFLVDREARDRIDSFESCSTMDSLRTGAGMPGLSCATAFPPLSPAEASAIRSSNSFAWTKAPRSFSAFISLPIFDNFLREQRLQEAQFQRDNARFSVRARELQTEADVVEAYLNVQTAIRTIELQQVNAQRAREQVTFAEERYRVGAATFLDVTTARSQAEQAQIDHLNAIYDYHRQFAALESAVGRPLR
jgi:outer membrane protein